VTDDDKSVLVSISGHPYMPDTHPQSKSSVHLGIFFSAALNCVFSFLRFVIPLGKLLKILIPE
jgi:hypothetical protein